MHVIIFQKDVDDFSTKHANFWLGVQYPLKGVKTNYRESNICFHRMHLKLKTENKLNQFLILRVLFSELSFWSTLFEYNIIE